MAETEEWSANANESLSISLLSPTPTDLVPIASFNPKFTYPIFGDDETIFGYKDLKVNLRYRANDMRPHLDVKFSRKFKAIGDTEPTDIKAILENGHLPKIAFVKEKDFIESSKLMSDDWTPPGSLHATIQGADGTYEIWKGSMATEGVKQLHSRIQIFIPFFVEGGSYIGRDDKGDADEEAARWTIWMLYRKEDATKEPKRAPYTFAGYSTVYRFFYFQAPTPPASPNKRPEMELPTEDVDLSTLPCKSRLSQFVILPPFQGRGNGALFYRAMYQYYLHHEVTREFTIEDPNEAFDDLRDVSDLAFLRTVPEFNALRINTTVEVPKTGPAPKNLVAGADLPALRQKLKIAPRQFGRVVEMHLMSQLPESVRPRLDLGSGARGGMGPPPAVADRKMYNLWRLLVKQRLYRHNREMLGQLELNERIDKLEETLGNVELEYVRILAMAARAGKYGEEKKDTASNGKRKLDEEAEASASKKARVEDVEDLGGA